MSFKMVVEEKQGVRLGVCDLFSRCLLQIPVKGVFPNKMFYIIFYLKHVLLLLKSETMQENYFCPEKEMN